MLRTPQPNAHQAIARPARAIAFQHALQFFGGSIGGIDAAAQRLATQSIGQLRTFRTRFDALNRFAQRSNFALRIESRVACGL